MFVGVGKGRSGWVERERDCTSALFYDVESEGKEMLGCMPSKFSKSFI